MFKKSSQIYDWSKLGISQKCIFTEFVFLTKHRRVLIDANISVRGIPYDAFSAAEKPLHGSWQIGKGRSSCGVAWGGGGVTTLVS